MAAKKPAKKAAKKPAPTVESKSVNIMIDAPAPMRGEPVPLEDKPKED
jgi:hypothetical protein